MRSLEELALQDRAGRAGEFASYVRHLGRADGMPSQAADLARIARAPARVIDALIKAPVNAGGLTEWGSELSDYRQLQAAFIDSLRHTSIFYRALADGALIRLPFQVRVGSIYAAAGAAVVTRGQAIPVAKMDLGAAELDRQKVGAIVVLTRELLDSGTAAEALISRSLRAGVSLAVDTEFVALIKTGAVTNAATANVLADLATALTAVGPTENSKLYWLAAPDVAIRLATVDTASANQAAFPGASPVGGSLLQIPMLVSSALPAGTLTLVDASGIGGASDGVEVMASRNAAIEMDAVPAGSAGVGSPEAPVGPTGPVASMWQQNLVAIRCLAYFGAAKMRPGGVATITGISW